MNILYENCLKLAYFDEWGGCRGRAHELTYDKSDITDALSATMATIRGSLLRHVRVQRLVN